MRIPFIFAVLAMALLADGDSFYEKFRYGVEIIERMLNRNAGTNFRSFFSIFKNKDQDDLTKNLLAAILNSMEGNKEEMTRTGVKMSIMLAKTISEAFSSDVRTSRSMEEKEFSPLDTLFRETQVRELMTKVRDPELTKIIVGELRHPDFDCLRLLICKISPFVRGMQESLAFFFGKAITGKGETVSGSKIWAESKPLDRMYLFLPDLKEFLSNGDVCDEDYPTCSY